MRQRFGRFVSPLRLPFLVAVLVLAAMASLPADSAAVCHPSRWWEYDYYYDAAHTQYAGYCSGACYAGGAFCIGDVTEYYVRYGGDYCGCGGEQASTQTPRSEENQTRAVNCAANRDTSILTLIGSPLMTPSTILGTASPTLPTVGN